MRAAFGVWLELLLSRSSFAGCSVLVLNLGQGSHWSSFFVHGVSIPLFFKGMCVVGCLEGIFLVLCIVFSSLNEMTCSSPALFDKKKLFNICSVLVLLHYLHVLIPFGLFLVLMFHLQA
jgi:hypothetical protein